MDIELPTMTYEQLRAVQALDFVRYRALRAKHDRSVHQALEEFRRCFPMSPLKARLELEAKAAISPGVTTDASWGAPLALASGSSEGFAGLVRASTILGRLPTRTAPLNSLLPVMTTSVAAGWTGQGLAKALGADAFATTSIALTKASAIITVSRELVELAIPGADVQLREELRRAVTGFLDVQAFDPAVTALADVRPASLTNGAPTTASAGATAANAETDLKGLVTAFIAQNPDASNLWLLMSPATAVSLAIATNAQTLTAQGGSVYGINVLTSTSVAGMLILLDANQIVVAEEPGIRLDVSTEATLQFDSAPSEPTAASSIFHALWQRNVAAVRAEKFIYYARLRTNAVRVVTAVAYA